MPPPDPNAPPSGIQGLLGNLFPGNNPAALYQGALTDPATQQQLNQRGLLAMAGSFADSAMPTRVPTPFGAVLGHAAAAMGPAEDAVMAARLQNAQALQEQALASLTQQKYNVFGSLLGDTRQWEQGDGTGSPTAPIAPSATIPGGATIPGAGPAPFGGGRGAMFTPEQISAAAIKNNLDPELVNTVVGIESSHGANTSNKISPSNTGLFQMAPANAPGGMNDKPENQLQVGINALAKEKADLEAKLGRPATNAEVYLAHQQGVEGAVALLTNPSKPAGEVTRPINISNNGGNPKLPASVFTDYWNNRYAHFSAPYANMATKPVQVASGGPGLLNPQQPVPGVPLASGQTTAPPPGGMPPPATAGAVPPLSPETKQFMRDKGISEEAIARADGALAAPPPGPGVPSAPPLQVAATPLTGQPTPLVTPPGPGPAPPTRYAQNAPGTTFSDVPQGGLLTSQGAPPTGAAPAPQAGPQPGAVAPGQPTPLVTPPGPGPAVPPITQPQAPGASPYANIPGAPSPQRVALARRIALEYSMAGLPIPPDVDAVLKFGMVGPAAAATAAAQQPFIQQNEAQKAQVTAQWQLFVKQNEPVLTRPNTLQQDPVTGRVFGNYEAVGPDGAMHRYVIGPGPGGQSQTKDLGQSAISPYQTKGQEGVAQKNSEDMATVNKDAYTAPQALAQATIMRQEAKNFYTGPGAAYNQDLNRILLALDPNNADRANKVASYEAFIKDAGYLSRQQAAATSARAGVQELKMVAGSMPSEETSPRGLDRVLGQIQGMADYRLAKQQAMNTYMQQPERGGWDTNGFEAQFNANVSPYAFMYMRYSDQDRAEMVQKLSQTKQGQAELQRLQGQIKYLTDNNLMPR